MRIFGINGFYFNPAAPAVVSAATESRATSHMNSSTIHHELNKNYELSNSSHPVSWTWLSCRSAQSPTKIPSGKNVLVIGASSFIGASIAKLLHEAGEPVVATEDNVNIGFDPLAWYRWEKLISMGLSPQFVNYSDYHLTVSFVKKYSPKFIVYIPTSPLEGKQSDETLRQFTELLEDYILLLEIIRTMFPSTGITLLSLTETTTTHRSMIKLFESVQFAYHSFYGMKTVIVRTKGVYGPWQSEVDPQESVSLCYITDLMEEIRQVMADTQTDSCRVTHCNVRGTVKTLFEIGRSKTRDWLKEYGDYQRQQTKDIIASPYFTTKRNAQYPIEFIPNNYYFMENWFKNIYKMNLHMVVFHDDLSNNFVSTFKAAYPKADFDKITDFKDFRPNDRRYLAYYDYILAHPEIRRIVMTDMRDVVIQNNPFEIMDVLGDIPYVGLDRPFFERSSLSAVAGVFKRCFGAGKYVLDYHREIEMLGFYNSGVTGGTRHVTLATLTRFLSHFQISNKDNCNMAIVGFIYHKFYFDVLATGWPFNTAFVTDQPNIPGLAVLHKWDLLSYN